MNLFKTVKSELLQIISGYKFGFFRNVLRARFDDNKIFKKLCGCQFF